MKAWRHKEYHHVYFNEVSYKQLQDGTFEAVYESFYPTFTKLALRYNGVSENDIKEQVESVLEYVELPKPKNRAFTVKPIAVHLNCPLCNIRMEYKPDHCARHEYYMHKCKYCGYEYEMPYVHDGQVVWAEAPEIVCNAINNYDLEELKSIVNTKLELT